jgi:predicted RNA binding protein YcfA (HicA-like mRNA interferase family)
MPKLYPSRKVVAVLQKNGFVFISQKGSHAKFRKMIDGIVVMTIVPMAKKEVPLTTFHSILNQTKLSEEDFKK